MYGILVSTGIIKFGGQTQQGQIQDFSKGRVDCKQSLFCSKIHTENERDCMHDIRAVSGEAASC